MKTLLTILLCCFVTSCTVNGLTNDYRKLQPKEREIIQKLSSFQGLKPKHVYVINANQLKEELKQNQKSLVYFFANGCTSDFCKPMKVYEDYSQENNYKLFLIMNGYHNLSQTLKQDFNAPLFSIDNEFYKTNFSFKYFKRFENELLGKPLDAKQMEYQGNIYFFENDKLVEIRREL